MKWPPPWFVALPSYAVLYAFVIWSVVRGLRRRRKRELAAYKSTEHTAYAECFGGPWDGQVRPCIVWGAAVFMNLYQLPNQGCYGPTWMADRLAGPTGGWVYGWHQLGCDRSGSPSSV